MTPSEVETPTTRVVPWITRPFVTTLRTPAVSLIKRIWISGVGSGGSIAGNETLVVATFLR